MLFKELGLRTARRTMRVVSTLLTLAIVCSATAVAAGPGTIRAAVSRTAFGIVHVEADDYAGLGYGQGYAFAQDNTCRMAEAFVTVNAQRSLFFGPDGVWKSPAQGLAATNLQADFFWQWIKDTGVVERLAAAPPPHGPGPKVRDLVRGWVRGWNRHLAESRASETAGPPCKNELWVRPVTEMDLYRRLYSISIFAGLGAFLPSIVAAAPPVDAAPAPAIEADAMTRAFPRLSAGSSGMAFGRSVTDNGRGLAILNPHFPWEGAERFHHVHLRIPGELDVSGGALFGLPFVGIGHNDRVAWTHMVSWAWHFTPVELTLVPGDPTSYMRDGIAEPMTSRTVMVRAADGSGASERTHTFYETRYGPVFETQPEAGMPWTTTTAYALGDPNRHNLRWVNEFIAMARATDIESFRHAQDEYQGLPFFATVATDADGKAYFAAHAAYPNVTDTQIEGYACIGSPVARRMWDSLQIAVLDGSRSWCDWRTDTDAAAAGIIGRGDIPVRITNRYVRNTNDSHWLAEPDSPLDAGRLYFAAYPRTPGLRARSGIVMARERINGSGGRPGGRATAEWAAEAAFANRNFAGELVRDDVVAMCRANPMVVTDDGPVDVREACDVLDAWDVRADTASRGALLFRLFWVGESGTGGAQATPAAALWRVPFDPADPVGTPKGLNTDLPQTKAALGEAVLSMRRAGVALDAPLGDRQFIVRRGVKIPLHGGPAREGISNQMDMPYSGSSYSSVNIGTSFAMVVRFTDGCPDVRSVVAYSQATDSSSSHYDDQTRLFSAKQWVRPPFCQSELSADPTRKTVVLRERVG